VQGGLASLENVVFSQALRVPMSDADLNVFQTGEQVPFTVRRVFTVHANGPTERGGHAHRRCGQVMVCLTGACDVTADDGARQETIELRRPQDVLYVPPSIWAAQSYVEPGTILMVLCDQDYDERDYIRDYDAFLAYRRAAV
jgi:hypothetical protein